MPLYQLSNDDFNSVLMPPFLADYLNNEEWTFMRSVVLNKATKSTPIALMIECAICVVFGFPCIFCCHPCIAHSIENRTGSAMEINRSLFGNRVVVTAIGDHFVINTDIISTTSVEDRSSSPLYDPHVTKSEATSTAIAPAAVTVSNHPQTMRFTLPDNTNIAPGSTMILTTPNNATIEVKVPHGARPGQEIIVEY